MTLPDQPAVPDTRPRPTWDAPGSWYRLGYFPAHDLSGVLMADWRHLGGQIVHMPEAIEAAIRSESAAALREATAEVDRLTRALVRAAEMAGDNVYADDGVLPEPADVDPDTMAGALWHHLTAASRPVPASPTNEEK